MAKIIKNIDTIPHTYAGQEIAAGEQYTIQQSEMNRWVNNDDLLSDISSGKIIINNGDIDLSGISNQIDFLKGNTPREVITQQEKPDKSLLLASAEAQFINNTCILQLIVPGTIDDMQARLIAGGYGFTNIYGWGDRISKVQVIDKDFVYAGIAYPATPEEASIPDTSGLSWIDIMPDGVIMGTYVDEGVPLNNQGWRLWADDGGQGGVDIDPLGGFGELPALTYLTITIEKTEESLATRAAMNVWWGNKK